MENSNETKTPVTHIWVGFVGAALKPMKRKDGSYFWTHRFTRGYRPDESSEEVKYSEWFSDRNDEALVTLMQQVIRFREDNCPKAFAEDSLKQAA